MHSAFRNEVKTMDYKTKRENDLYSAYKDVRYTSTLLRDIQKAMDEIRYTIDGSMTQREFAEAVKFVVHDQIEASNLKTTVTAFEAIIEAIDARIAEMAK